MKKFILSAFSLAVLVSFSTIANAQHYVKKGESLTKIARIHHMTLKDLISLNPQIKNPNQIQVNQYIIIRSKSETKKDMTDYARTLADITAYSYGANNFPYLTDCSGFVKGVFAKFGIALPRTSVEQSKQGKPVKFSELQMGDLMFFSTRADKTITHVGINLGNDFWISNLNEAKDVEILSNWNRWTQENFMWGARFEM
jgi:cell wall-associated NlpC family hydrolase